MHDDGIFDEAAAERYDESSAEMFAPHVLGPTVDFLAELAGTGSALEFAIGTGRVAIPLAARGVPVSGIEISRAMVAKLQEKPGASGIDVVIGDMTAAVVDGRFSLVYLVFNTIGNVASQEGQVAVFNNAARHLSDGGYFVVEVGVPALRKLPPGQSAIPFHVSADRFGFDELNVVTQHAVSHHIRIDEGVPQYFACPYRYVWPAELDLMAQLAGMRLVGRWANWNRDPFTADSTGHVSVWQPENR